MAITRIFSGLMAAALLAASLAPAGSALAAQTAQSATIVASGLASPRGLAMDGKGNLYIAEAGRGGDQVITIGEGEEKREFKTGMTGQITKVRSDGTKEVVVAGLMSLVAFEGEALGPQGIAYADGALWLTTSCLPAGAPKGPWDGALLRVDTESGAITKVADLQAYEFSKNPDGFFPDSNPFGLAVGDDGMAYVADAGANTLLRVDPSNGTVETVAVFDGFPLPKELQGPGPFEQGNPGRNGAMELDPVPTGVAIAPDGSIYVGFLSGFPFLTGMTKVVNVSADGVVSDAATGLTQVLDVAVGSDGMLYASQFNEFSLMSQPPGYAPGTGKVIRIMNDGSTQTVADGLDFPTGLEFDAIGNLYVAVNSLSPTDGQVIRIANVTSGGVGMPSTGTGFPLETALYLSLIALAAGCAIRFATPAFASRQTRELR